MRRRAIEAWRELHPLALALVIGGVGGTLFATLDMPLAWMLGAMCLTTVAALAGANVRVPMRLRALMIAVLGIMLGSAFRPEILERVGQWGVSLSALVIYVVAVAAVATYYFRRIARYGRITSYFAGIPGGFTQMILIGGAMGGDDRTIALTHAARVLLVVLVIPFWFRAVAGYQPQPGGAGAPLVAIPAIDLAILGLCGVVGFAVASVLRLPSPTLTGPMVLSAAVHLGALTASRPPTELIIAAQLVVGASIGCRFAGIPVRHVLRAVRYAIGSTVVMLAIGIAFSAVLATGTGLPFSALVLALAPGGLAEMSLIALALDIDPAFVSTHHVVRIFLVVILAPLAYKALERTWMRRAPGRPPCGD